MATLNSMRTIRTLKEQTISDIAIQEYGNIEAVMELIDNNPHLVGMNDYSSSDIIDNFCDFDVSIPIRENVRLYINDSSHLMNRKVLKELNGKKIHSPRSGV